MSRNPNADPGAARQDPYQLRDVLRQRLAELEMDLSGRADPPDFYGVSETGTLRDYSPEQITPLHEQESQRPNMFPEIEAVMKTHHELVDALTDEIYRLRGILAEERTERQAEQEQTLKVLDQIRTNGAKVFVASAAPMQATPTGPNPYYRGKR